MRWHVGTALSLLAFSQSAQASGPPYHYRRQDQQAGYNGTVVPARLPSASSTNYNITSVTVTYAFIPETHNPIPTSAPTISVVSDLLIISTFSEKLSIQGSPSNFTSSTTSEAASSSATRRPYPLSGAPSQSYVVPGNGTYPTAPKLSASQSGGVGATPRPKMVRPKPSNETCGGETLNVVNAHLDYWYTETYTHTVSTLSVQFNGNDSQTGWTIVPATTEFDISTAITGNTCGPSTSLDTAYNRTTTRYDCFTTPTPVADSTTVLSVDAFTPARQTTGNGTDIPNLATEPPKAVATLPSAAGTFTEGTPFVYFSEFEIESSQPTILPNGSDGCAVLTRSFMLNRLFSFAFEGDEDELSQERLMSEDGASGDIDQSFARRVGLPDSVKVGTFSAQPTVIVVVERNVVAQAVLAGSTMSPGGALITPEPTLPSFLSHIATTTPTAPTTHYSPRIEQTEAALDVPTKTVEKFSRFGIFLAHLEHSETTLILPTPTDTNVITTRIHGTVVTATALSNVLVDASNGNSGSGNSNSNGNANGNSNGNAGSNNGNGSGGNSNGNSGNSNSNGHANGNSNGNAGSSNGNGNSGSKNDNNGNSGNGAGNAGNDGDAVITGSVFSGTNVEKGGDDEGDWIMMPFVAHLENSAITLDVPAPSTAEVVTAAFGGKVLTATALHAVETGSSNQNGGSNGHNTGGNGAGSNSGNGQNGRDGVFGNFVSAIVNAAKPTNAAEVLSQAMAQEHHDSTAAAIAAGIGGLVADAGSFKGGSNGGSNGGNIGSAGGSSNGHDGPHSGSSHSPGSGSQFNSGSGSGADSGSQFSSGSGSQSHSGSSSADGSGSDSGSGSGSQFGSQSESNGAGGSGSKVQLGASPGQVLTVDGATITASPANAFVIDGQTAVPGGAPITVDGTVISVPASANGIIVDGRTVPGEFASSTVFNINGMAITAMPGVGFPIAGQTLQAGGAAITVDGTRLSLAPGGTALVIGSSTSAITAGAGAASEIPELTIGSQTFTANAATQFYLAPGQTLTPGGTAVISGTTLSLESGASAVVVNGETRIFGSSSPDSMITSSPSIIRVDGQAFAANAGGTYLISGQTLTPGGSITITGSNGEQTLSLSPSGAELVAIVSGHTITNTLSDSASAADATAAPVLTIGGQTFTALPGSDGANPTYLINGETLSAGEKEIVTIDGKTYVVSLAPGATLLEVEEMGASGKAIQTLLQTLFPATATGMTSTMGGSGSRSGNNGDDDDDGETGTGTGTASPARKTGAASSSIDGSQLGSVLVAMGTLLLVGVL
jgi:hypothetical protein